MPKFTTSDNVDIYYKHWNGNSSPDACTAVLIHGWPLNADMWDNVGQKLVESGINVIAYDRRGFGRSEQPWDGYDYDTLANDLNDLLSFTQVKNVTLVGFSMGGGEAVRCVAKYRPQSVNKCVLIGSVTPFLLKPDDDTDGAPESVFDEMKIEISKDRPAFFESFFPNFYSVGQIPNKVSEPTLKWTQTLAMQASRKATLDCVTSFGTTDFRPDLANLDLPTLIIHGTRDNAVPIEISGRPSAKAISNSQLIEITDGPHGLTETHPDQLASELIAFINR